MYMVTPLAMRLVSFLVGSFAQAEPAALDGPPWPREVQGMGLTIHFAKKDALHQAEREVLRFLQQQDFPIQAWRPTEEFLRKNLLDGPGRLGADLTLPDVGLVRTWHYQVRLPDLQMIGRLAQEARREERAAARQYLAARIMVGVAAALVLIWGFQGFHHRKSR